MHILCDVNEQEETELPIGIYNIRVSYLGNSGFKSRSQNRSHWQEFFFVISGLRRGVNEIIALL
jgi:hypothetical protein